MAEPQTTPDPEEESTCSNCYVYGVLISLLASSFQSAGYALWRLHHLRKQRQQVHPVLPADKADVPASQPDNEVASPAPAVLATEPELEGTEVNVPQGPNGGIVEQKIDVNGNGDGEVVHDHRTQSDDRNENGTDVSTINAPPPAAPQEKLEHERQPKCWQGTSYYGVPWVWVCGLAAIGFGNGLDFISLGLTKQSVVTLVGSWSLVVTTLISPLLGETLTRLDMTAAGITVVGIILTVLGGYTEITDWSTEKLISQYRQPHVIVMLSILATCVVSVVAILLVDYTRRLAQARKEQQPMERPNTKTIGPLYILLAALIATFTVLLGKATSEMLLPTLTGDNRFTSPAALLLVCSFLISLPSQLLLISASLSINDSLYHVPTFYIFWIFGSITTGAIFYEEMESFKLVNWLLFAFGVATLLVGVCLTTVAARRKPPTE